MRYLYSIIGLLIVLNSCAQVQSPQKTDNQNLYKKMTFISGNDSLNYRILYPDKYDINKKYPLLLLLHGSGERGSDNEKQLIHNTKLFEDSARRVQYPMFVVIPQCPENDYWGRIKVDTTRKDSLGGFSFESSQPMTRSLSLVSKMIDSLAHTPQVDNKRLYVGGLSMGGIGTYELLWRKPGVFAAAFPICGGGDPSKVNIYARKFPIWVFHGGSDPVVPVGNARLMVNALMAAGAKVKYTEYPGVGHNSWDNAFAEPALIRWLMEQQKPGLEKL